QGRRGAHPRAVRSVATGAVCLEQLFAERRVLRVARRLLVMPEDGYGPGNFVCVHVKPARGWIERRASPFGPAMNVKQHGGLRFLEGREPAVVGAGQSLLDERARLFAAR